MVKRAKSVRRTVIETDPDVDAATEEARRPRQRHAVTDHDDVRELEAALRIDEHALEEALRDQPETFYRVAKGLALEISRRDGAKQALQDAEFAADLRVRGQAEKQEKKITEGEVRARVHGDDEVVFAREEYARLCESAGKLAALKEAFQQRSYALKDMVGLYIANYYSASENSAAGASMRDRSAGEARARMNEARRRGDGERA